MNLIRYLWIVFGISGTVWVASDRAEVSLSQSRTISDRGPIRPIPLAISLDARKVTLGERLFGDRHLSRNNTVSCADCHNLRQGGADGKVHSIGIGGAESRINAPTVFNSSFNFKQFWDGRVATLEEQIDAPIQSASEMASTWEEVVSKLRADPIYRVAFAKVYPGGIQASNIRNAIAEFERSLVTPNAKFDRFLRGDEQALNQEERVGYVKFKTYGCTSCHQGVNIGGNMFETFGVLGDYFTARGEVTEPDYGRFNVTGKEEDRFVFKVPSLRNVALTAPYFHDGSAKTLEAAVAIMGQYQLGQTIPPEDVAQLVLFLKTLTGEYGGHPL